MEKKILNFEMQFIGNGQLKVWENRAKRNEAWYYMNENNLIVLRCENRNKKWKKTAWFGAFSFSCKWENGQSES